MSAVQERSEALITDEQIRSVKAPFDVRFVGKKRVATVVGFSENDPLGVGGYMGIIPDMATVYFKGGGWLLLRDLMRHYELVEDLQNAKSQ